MIAGGRELESRVLIVDDHPLVRAGLASLIDAESGIKVCGEASGVQDALALVPELEPDLVIVDLSLADGSGLDLIKRLSARNANLKLLVCSMHDEAQYAERALKAGAMGYINKQQVTRQVHQAIRQILSGKVYLSEKTREHLLSRMVGGGKLCVESTTEVLSDRELEVFELIGSGLGTSQIAQRLNLSVKTIESHKEKLKRKLNVKSGTELNRRAFQWVAEHS